MSKHLDGADGLCANMKDVFYNSTYWRGKKTKDEVDTDVEKHQIKEE